MSTIYQMNDDTDEIDVAMSQIEYLYEPEYRMDDQFDEIDVIISQIDVNDGDVDAMIEICDTDMDQMDGGYELVDHRGGGEANLEIVGEPDLEADGNVEFEADGDVEFEADVNDIPAEMLQEYQEALYQILPKKSASRYLQAYAVFRKWQQSRKTKSFDEKVIMVYFSEAAKKYKPSTLWSMYSMLKKTLICKNNIDISKISQLIAFLKTISAGYKSKKSNVFCSEEVQRFMVEAPDISFLGIKAIAAMGFIGGLRGGELTDLCTENVKDNGREIIVRIPQTKTKEPKLFTIDGELAGIVRQYMKLRPTGAPTNRFFVQYRKGKCTRQVMGKNAIAKVPKVIAKFLGLPEESTYTGQGIRRSSTTILADTGAGFSDVRRHGQWKSSVVCEGYIANSLTHKRKTTNLISSAINLPSTSKVNEIKTPTNATKMKITSESSSQIKVSTNHSISVADNYSGEVSLDISGNVSSCPPSTVVCSGPPSTVVSSGPSSTVVSSGPSNTVVSNNHLSNVVSSGVSIADILPLASEGKIIFHFAGQITNFNLHMKQ